jgi:glutamate carboxypeptidase
MPPTPLTDVETRLCRAISQRRPALLEDLRLHVGLPTGGNNTGALEETRERLTSRLAALGASVELIPGDAKPGWLHGVQPGGWIPPTAVCRRGPARILLSGHMDTVHDPAGSFRELTIAPDGRRAAGPGCVDMKGGLVIAVAALEALAEAGIDVPWTFILNSDEESGSYHSESALRAEGARVAAAGGVGLVFEPALPSGGLVLERLGSGQFQIECRGRAAHVGRDFEKGVSAVTALAGAVLAVSRLPDRARGKIVNIGPLEGGSATNVVPDRARAWGNVRYPSREIADELQAELMSLQSGAGELPEVTVRTSFNRPAKPLTPQVKALADRVKDASEALGQGLPFGKTGGVCDGNILQDEGLPTIDTLGVRGGGLHTPEEWIDLSSLVERCQLAAVLMHRLAQ